MKKCPKCEADIQENARFCLYCMTSFEEKKPVENKESNNNRWLIIIAAVLVLVIIILSVFVLNKIGNNSDATSPDNSTSQNLNNDNSNTDNTDNQDTTTTPQKSDESPNPPQNNNNSNNDNNQTDSSSDNQYVPPVVDNTPTNSQPKFIYIEATIENTYPTGYSAMYTPENAIVITKVDYIEESGNYVVPDTIDGKKVAAIMPSAFSDSSISYSVKTVTLPSTVKTVWNKAFENCNNLTDIYLKSAVIGIYEDAFPAVSNRNGTLTIHCKKDCRNFDFYYYKNIANKYGADYKEWNG